MDAVVQLKVKMTGRGPVCEENRRRKRRNGEEKERRGDNVTCKPRSVNEMLELSSVHFPIPRSREQLSELQVLC